MKSVALADRLKSDFDTLSVRFQEAARWVIDNPADVALLTTREQARRAGVSPATMTRLAQHFGLTGYDEVRKLYADAVRRRPESFRGRAQELLERRKAEGDEALVQDIFSSLTPTPAGAVVAGGEQALQRRRRTDRARGAGVLPRPAFDILGRLHLPLCALAVRRGLGAGRRLRRHRDRCVARDRKARRAARGDGEALHPRDAQGRALCAQPRRAKSSPSPTARFRRSRPWPTKRWWSAPRRRPSFTPWRRPSPPSNVSPRWSPRAAAIDTLKALARKRGATGGVRHLRAPVQNTGLDIMTHILHRTIGHDYPVAVSGQGIFIRDARRQGLSRCVRRRGGVVPRPFASRRARRVARAARHPRICAYELLHDAGRRRTRRRSRSSTRRTASIM